MWRSGLLKPLRTLGGGLEVRHGLGGYVATDFSFLEDYIDDPEAAARLTRILNEAAGPGSLAHVIHEIRQALIRRATTVLRRDFPALRDQVDPQEMVKDFGYQLDRVMRNREPPVQTVDEFFGVACTQFRRMLLDRVRTQSRRKRLEEQHGPGLRPPRGQDPADLADQRMQLERILTIVQRRGKVDQRIFDLRFFGGFTLEEIAAKVALPRSTVHNRLERMRTALREGLGTPQGESPSP